MTKKQDEKHADEVGDEEEKKTKRQKAETTKRLNDKKTR